MLANKLTLSLKVQLNRKTVSYGYSADHACGLGASLKGEASQTSTKCHQWLQFAYSAEVRTHVRVLYIKHSTCQLQITSNILLWNRLYGLETTNNREELYLTNESLLKSVSWKSSEKHAGISMSITNNRTPLLIPIIKAVHCNYISTANKMSSILLKQYTMFDLS